MIELKSGFFNAVMVDNEPDRTYTAEQVNDYFKGLISDNGIFATVSNACQVIKNTGMSVFIKSGRGKVGNNWFEIDKDYTIDIPSSDVILNRIDRIVISRDNSTRATQLKLLKGELSSSPTPPSLTRNETTYEICLANIIVNKNTTAITYSMIQDTRSDNSVCGWIVGLIEQFDTTTLFNQYKDAQDTFIDETSKNFTNWETTQKSDFDAWFNNIKETVKTANIYREYKALYATASENEKVLMIPSAINFVNNSLDVLEIRVNDFVLAKDEFSINTQGTQVILANAIDKIGTRIEFVNKKCVEGTVAESTVTRLDRLENQVNSIGEYVYEATGDNDNKALSTMVKNFLNGVGNYASVQDNSQLYISVNGTLGIATSIDKNVFDFTSDTTSKRKAIIDFSRATIPNIALTDTALTVIKCGDNVTIKNANIKIEQSNSQTIYSLYGGNHENISVYINGTYGTLYGAYDCHSILNSNINIENATGTCYGCYSCKKVLYNEININSGTSIEASGKQLLMGNFVNKPINVDDTVTNIGTITL